MIEFCTTNAGVCGSYPVPPEAKLTPVIKSLFCIFGSRYAGTVSLTPNSEAEIIKKMKFVALSELIKLIKNKVGTFHGK